MATHDIADTAFNNSIRTYLKLHKEKQSVYYSKMILYCSNFIVFRNIFLRTLNTVRHKFPN